MQKYETDAFDDDTAVTETIQAYGARIAALVLLFDQQALELEFSKRPLCQEPAA
ncbi:hypothetical protein [Methylobacterium sp. WL30]|uniref:hypothetical protein n=1 Tax=Methylobacterium sp. WL30 TaxID=2603895 RepID=UPI0016509562|nr:hypothetical protein [Methylobacterium sp. WL30]